MASTDTHTNPSALAVPPGGCDCHTHVFPGTERYPFAQGRKYTPPAATAQDLAGLMARLGLQRVVIVQPSVYGEDNSATLEGIRALGKERARGVAVIGDATSARELDELAGAGVRGVRVNLELAGEADPQRCAGILQDTARRIAGHGWHIQIYAQLGLVAELAATIASLPVPVVLDHFAGARAEGGAGQPGMGKVLGLVRSGQVYVKLSGCYRSSSLAPGYEDSGPLARALVEANPDRMLWGSDWPHPDPSRHPGRTVEDVNPPLPVDDEAVFGLLRQWAGTQDIYNRILSRNPARLYGFE